MTRSSTGRSSLVVRDVRRRPVDPGRHPVGRHPRARGRRAPVDHDPLGRARAARCIAWEPAFGQDLEWALLHALSRLGRPDGESAYFRLSTRPIDQALAARARAMPDGRERAPRQALAGGYRLRSAGDAPAMTIVAVGALVPEAVAAADELGEAGVACDVVCLTSPDLVFRAFQARRGLAERRRRDPGRAVPGDRAAPIVTVLDGHPHTLSFLAAVQRRPIACLGVNDFGQSGDVDDLYRYFGLDTGTIVGAALDLLEESSMTEITMPRLSDSMEEGTILTWLKDDGEPCTSATSWSRSRPTRRR